MKLEDLPADVQRQVRAQLGQVEKQPRTSKRVAHGGTFRMRCECGEEFRVAARLDRHPATKGHRRVECVFEESA